MSIGPLGSIPSFAATSLAQTKAADVAKVQQDTADAARAAEGSERAESAAGIGRTEEDGEASDRDADGRRLWEQFEEQKNQETPEPPAAGETLPQSKDPSGSRGGLLDISG